MEEFNLMLVNLYGLPAATALRVVQRIENGEQTEIDLQTIETMWNDCYIALSPSGKPHKNACVFQTFIGLLFHNHIIFSDRIKIKNELIRGKNYDYVKTAIDVLEKNFDETWPPHLSIQILWNIILYKHRILRKSYNYQLHILKVLIEHDLIKGIHSNKKPTNSQANT